MYHSKSLVYVICLAALITGLACGTLEIAMELTPEALPDIEITTPPTRTDMQVEISPTSELTQESVTPMPTTSSSPSPSPGLSPLDQYDMKSVLAWFMWGITNKDMAAVEALIGDELFYSIDPMEGGQGASKQAFLSEFQNSVTGDPTCDGVIVRSEEAFTIWTSNWTHSWEMSEFCYGGCATIDPPVTSDVVAFSFNLYDSGWALRSLYLNSLQSWQQQWPDYSLVSCETILSSSEPEAVGGCQRSGLVDTTATSAPGMGVVGTISITPAVETDTNCFAVQANTPIVISWLDAPAGMSYVEFHRRSLQMNKSDVMGTLTDAIGGYQIEVTFGSSMEPSIVWTFGDGVMSDYIEIYLQE